MPREVRVKFIGQGWCAVVCVSYMLHRMRHTYVKNRNVLYNLLIYIIFPFTHLWPGERRVTAIRSLGVMAG